MNNKFIATIINKLTEWYETAVEMLPNFAVAILILLVFVIMARWVKRGVTNLLGRTYSNAELTRIISKISFLAVVVTGVMFALSALHLQKTVTSLLAGAGIVGLALSFAFQDLATNFISGLFIAAKRPYAVGDFIETQNHGGTVKNINLRNTEIETFDGDQVLVPNRLIFENPLKNFYTTKSRRVDLSVGVSYNDDLELVERVSKEAVSSLPNLVEDKEVKVIFTEFAGSSINLEVRYWVPYDDYFQYLEGISEGIKAIKKAYDDHNITIPFPIRTLELDAETKEVLSMDTLRKEAS